MGDKSASYRYNWGQGPEGVSVATFPPKHIEIERRLAALEARVAALEPRQVPKRARTVAHVSPTGQVG